MAFTIVKIISRDLQLMYRNEAIPYLGQLWRYHACMKKRLSQILGAVGGRRNFTQEHLRLERMFRMTISKAL